jgi:hypothetical protein
MTLVPEGSSRPIAVRQNCPKRYIPRNFSEPALNGKGIEIRAQLSRFEQRPAYFGASDHWYSSVIKKKWRPYGRTEIIAPCS